VTLVPVGDGFVFGHLRTGPQTDGLALEIERVIGKIERDQMTRKKINPDAVGLDVLRAQGKQGYFSRPNLP